MEFGAHLPLIDFGDGSYTLPRLQKYAAAARDLGVSVGYALREPHGEREGA
jgi:hypothetical protein